MVKEADKVHLGGSGESSRHENCDIGLQGTTLGGELQKVEDLN